MNIPISDPLKIENSLTEELNMDFNHEQYEHHFTEHSNSNNFSNSVSLSVCGLCGVVGKLLIKVDENQELISNIKKYMPFIDMQNHFSDSVCYQCSSQINSWNGFYHNCSFVNSKFKNDPVIPEINSTKYSKKRENATNVVYGDPIDKINESYNRLEENPSLENISCTMDVLTDCLKSLISQLKTAPSDFAESNEVTLLESSNESESNSEFASLIKPIDVIEVNLAESDIEINPKKNMKFIQVHQIRSHHGTVFYDEEGYTYRVNKKQPGKVYVRCADYKCPVRGSICGNSFKSNKHTHTHPPPKVMKNGRLHASAERVIKVANLFEK